MRGADLLQLQSLLEGASISPGLRTARARCVARALALSLILIGSAVNAAAEPATFDASKPSSATSADDAIEGFYLLNFNRWGELETPLERDQIIEDLLAGGEIQRVLIISYGWANDGESSYGIYRELVRDLLPEPTDGSSYPKAVVIGVGWDSSQTGVRKLANDLIPFPVLASWLAFIPDSLLFPISFWSKAAMADRIGYGGLRIELNKIFETVYPDDGSGKSPHPEIVLIGHSFGTRIASGLMKEELALADVSSEAFSSAKHVSAAILIQPALVLSNLHRNAEYPVLITQSRHDHANGFLFPAANLAVNAYSFTSFEAIARHRVFGVVTDEVKHRTSQAAQLVFPGYSKPTTNESQGEFLGGFSIPAPHMADNPFELFQAGMAEVASIPFSLLYSTITTPIYYAGTQARGLWAGPHNHVMNTLAQLPVVEILVDFAGDLAKRKIPWGSRSKGFLDFGLLNESSGRLFVKPFTEPEHLPVVAFDDLADGKTPPGLGCLLSECKGLIFVDASTVIDKGIFGLSLENRAVDYTFGWLDPIGSHANYRNPEVVKLMSRFLNSAAPLSSKKD